MKSRRSEYISGLRKLADLLDKEPMIPMPSDGQWSFSPMGITFENSKGLAEARRLIGGKFEKNFTSSYVHLRGKLDGLFLDLYVERDQVCTKRVVGFEEVTEEIPDPHAQLVTVTRTKEIVEWDCHPVLDGEAQ